MNKENIEKQLRDWFSLMTKKYNWLRIKFEFNEIENVYMVSFSPAKQIELSDEFNKDAMLFADEINDKYGIEAPLFTDEEELFNLSEIAETIGGTIPFSSSTAIMYATTNHTFNNSWTSPIISQKNVQTKKNFRPSSLANEKGYAFAA